MEQQKKDRMSFMLYKDIKPLVLGMTDTQAGILLKSIYSYTCDNEELTCEDAMVSSVFSFVKEKLNYSEEQYEKKCEQNRENARKRWDKDANERIRNNATACDGIIRNATECEVMLTDTDTDTYTKTKTDIKENIYTDEFLEFYSLYPKKENKAAAYKRFKDLNSSTRKDIINIVSSSNFQTYYANKIASEKSKQYIKAPDVWINKGCWEDELDVMQQKPKHDFSGR